MSHVYAQHDVYSASSENCQEARSALCACRSRSRLSMILLYRCRWMKSRTWTCMASFCLRGVFEAATPEKFAPRGLSTLKADRFVGGARGVWLSQGVKLRELGLTSPFNVVRGRHHGQVPVPLTRADKARHVDVDCEVQF